MKESSPVVCASFGEVIATSPLAQLEADRLSAVRASLEEGAKAAEGHYAGMTAAAATQAREADARLLNAQWSAELQGARAVVIAQVRAAAAELVKKKGYGMIIDRDLVMVCAAEKDVTVALAASLKNVKLDFGSLPMVTPVEIEKH